MNDPKMDPSNGLRIPEHMTQEMLDVIDSLPDFREEWKLCHLNITKAKQACCALPAESVTGGAVLQISRLRCHWAESYWASRLRVLASRLDRSVSDQLWEMAEENTKNVLGPEPLPALSDIIDSILPNEEIIL